MTFVNVYHPLLIQEDFQEYTNTALRTDHNFPLACHGGPQLEAHRVALVASSPVFDDFLKRNKNAIPLIYMSRMKSEDLLAILDLLYFGETSIYGEFFENFLIVANELNLREFNLDQQTKGPEIFRHVHHSLCVTCHVSHNMCNVSCVLCLVSHFYFGSKLLT